MITQQARETAERILAMQSDRTNASLTVRSLPDVIQAAMDQHAADKLKPIYAELDALPLVDLSRNGFSNLAARINRIKAAVAVALEEAK